MTVDISPVNIDERKSLGIRAGDTVRVSQKIQEKGKTRIQIFEGLVLAQKHGAEAGATFTVRRVAKGFGVEKIFPLYSPMIDKIEIVRRSKVRRSKLYFIREKVAREIRKQMRNMRIVSIATESGIEATQREKAEADTRQKEEDEKAAADAKAAEEKAKADEADASASSDSEEEKTQDNPAEDPEPTETEEKSEEVAEDKKED